MDAFRQKQLETLLAADRAVRTVLRALHDTGRLHNTIIVFASDNGYMWGEHRLAGKYAPYEESIRVPFVLRWDQLDLVPGVNQELITNADLAPTLADLAGVSSRPTDGLSLRPLLTDTADAWRPIFPLERLAELDARDTSYCGVRGANVVFVHYEDGEEEFYRLKRDPYERKNLAGDASWSRRNALRDRTRT